MNWFSGLVLLAVLWFMTLFIILPMRLKTQGEAGTIVKGTHGSSPEDAQIKKKFLITSVVAVILWGICLAVILSGAVTMEDFNLFTRFGGELY